MDSKFDKDYPIKVPCELNVLLKPFFGTGVKKDEWIYEKLPPSEIFTLSGNITEGMIVHLAGFLTPLFGWKTVKIQEAFPDALYEDMDTRVPIRVEFEKYTKDFLDHGHPASECDVILCWEDNLTKEVKDERLFEENPGLQIIELKRIFFHYDFDLKLPS